MLTNEHSTEPDSDYWRLKPMIDKTYPAGRFVAILEGQVVTDAERFDELIAKLKRIGINPNDAIIVQAQEDYLEYGVIF